MRITLVLGLVSLLACGGETSGDTGPTTGGGSAGASVDGGGGNGGSGSGTEAGSDSDATTNPCSGKACGESCHSWRVNAEACDINGSCEEANWAGCTCNPCSQACLYLHLCDGGPD
jgi:hypothetical protein